MRSLYRSCFVLVLGATIVLLCAPLTSQAVLTVDFTLIADESTTLPEVGSTFVFFGGTPSIEGDTVAFTAVTGGSNFGVYKGESTSSLTHIASSLTTAPSPASGFLHPTTSAPTISGGTVAFLATATSESGVFTGDGASVGFVANVNTASPSAGAGDFFQFGAPDISGSRVVFFGSDGPIDGVYEGSVGGSVSTIADENTDVPGPPVTDFTGFLNPVVSGSYVAIIGQSAIGPGVYRYQGGSGVVIADDGTSVPGNLGELFNLFKWVAISDANVAFTGRAGSGEDGVYFSDGTTLSLVADENTAIPDGSGNFVDFDSERLSLSGTTVAFIGVDSLGPLRQIETTPKRCAGVGLVAS